MSTPRERIIQSLLFGALGDALGMPWETKTRAQILEMTEGVGVTTFVDPATIRDDAVWSLGEYTDDTQLSIVVAESLIASNGWNPLDCMLRHIDAMQACDAGWGGTTKQAVAAFEAAYADNFSIRPDVSRPPVQIAGRGGGNGPLMKVAPLALATVCERGVRYTALLRERCRELAFLTHGDPDVAIATFAGACFIAEGVIHPIDTRIDGLLFLERIVLEVREMERLFARAGYPSEWHVPLSRKLEQIPDVLDDYDRLLALTANGIRPFVARTSAVMAITLFLRNIGNPERAMLEAVNAGGDTDTNAAIVGNIVGAHGARLMHFDDAWQEFVFAHEHTFNPVLQAGKDIAHTFLK